MGDSDFHVGGYHKQGHTHGGYQGGSRSSQLHFSPKFFFQKNQFHICLLPPPKRKHKKNKSTQGLEEKLKTKKKNNQFIIISKEIINFMYNSSHPPYIIETIIPFFGYLLVGHCCRNMEFFYFIFLNSKI